MNVKNLLIVSILCALTWTKLHAQVNVRDSTIFAPMISATYTFQIPGGDMKNRFGNNSNVGASFIIKDKKNYLYGFTGGFLFGDNVVENTILDGMKTANGTILNSEGLVADVYLYQRGFSFFGNFGKQFPIMSPNKNSGIYLIGGLGYIQHKIKIQDKGGSVPQLRDEFLNGYDRLTNGMALSEAIGYRYLGNRRLTNFYIEVEFVQGFTKNRRSFNYDTMSKDDSKRTDLLTGFKFGWTIPLYKKVPREFYYY